MICEMISEGRYKSKHKLCSVWEKCSVESTFVSYWTLRCKSKSSDFSGDAPVGVEVNLNHLISWTWKTYILNSEEKWSIMFINSNVLAFMNLPGMLRRCLEIQDSKQRRNDYNENNKNGSILLSRFLA